MTSRQTELASSPAFSKQVEFSKLDYERGIAYGFAIVSTVNGAPYWDLQDDHIPESAMVEAASEFMAAARVGKDQHRGDQVADILFGTPVTTGELLAWTDGTVRKTGFWIGYKPQDPVQFDMIASGERTGFSIGGYLLEATEAEVGKAVWSTATVDKLPDSAFLHVKAGGKKDAEGMTMPRSHRMFPVRGPDGKVDMPHLKNALARIPQAKIADAEKEKISARARALLAETEKEFGKAYGDGRRRGRVFRSFKIAEISLVDRPAQEGATVSVVKHVIAKADVSKSIVVTSTDAGHQHVVCLDRVLDDDYSCTTWEYTTGADKADGDTHGHKVYVLDGKLVVTMNAGHGHTVETPAGWAPPVPSPPDSPAPGVQIIANAAPPKADRPKHDPDSAIPVVQLGLQMLSGHDVRVELGAGADAGMDDAEKRAAAQVVVPVRVEVTGVDDAARAIESLRAADKSASVQGQSGQEPTTMSMTEAEIATLKARADQATAAEARAVRAEKVAELSDVQKAYFGKLTAADQSVFLAKTSPERQMEVDQAAVYKSTDGTLYFKNDDPRMVSVVKTNDELRAKLAKQEEATATAETASFAKATIAHVPGEDAHKVALAKAVSAIGDEPTRTAVTTMLKAADAACAWLAEAQGHSVVNKDAPDSPEAAFYKARDEWAKAGGIPMSTDIDKATATRQFMQTPQGAPLYRKYTESKPARA